MLSPQSQSSTELLCVLAFVLAALFLIWRGWRLGLIRMLLSIGALFGAYFLGVFGGPFLAPLLRPTGLPDPLLELGGGILLGLGFYIAARTAGAIVFKRTAHQSFALLRLLFGLTGAALGVVDAAALLLVLAMSVRVAGTIAEGNPAVPPVLTNLKQKIDDSFLGPLIDSFDPISREHYRTMRVLAGMLSSQRNLARFVSSIPAAERDPKLVALQNDRQLTEQIQKGSFWDLLKNPKVVGIVNDPKLRELLSSIDSDQGTNRQSPKPKPH